MKLEFLCPTHRMWLADDPARAIGWWSNSYENGKSLCEQALWQDALPYVGCAYETSEMLLSSKEVDRRNVIAFFTSSALLLAETLTQLGYRGQSREVYLASLNRLNREQSSEAVIGVSISRQAKRLKRGLDQLKQYGFSREPAFAQQEASKILH